MPHQRFAGAEPVCGYSQVEETGQRHTCIASEVRETDPIQKALARQVVAAYAGQRSLRAELRVRTCPRALCTCPVHHGSQGHSGE